MAAQAMREVVRMKAAYRVLMLQYRCSGDLSNWLHLANGPVDDYTTDSCA